MSDSQKEFLDAYQIKIDKEKTSNGIDYTIDKIIEFHKRILKLEAQNKIMKDALEEILGYWGACGEDCKHPTGYGLYEFTEQVLEKSEELGSV